MNTEKWDAYVIQVHKDSVLAKMVRDHVARRNNYDIRHAFDPTEEDVDRARYVGREEMHRACCDTITALTEELKKAPIKYGENTAEAMLHLAFYKVSKIVLGPV